MVNRESGKLDYTKLVFPLGLLLVGIALIIYSVPGQGKNLPNAIGILLAFAGALWTHRVRAKRSH